MRHLTVEQLEPRLHAASVFSFHTATIGPRAIAAPVVTAIHAGTYPPAILQDMNLVIGAGSVVVIGQNIQVIGTPILVGHGTWTGGLLWD